MQAWLGMGLGLGRLAATGAAPAVDFGDRVDHRFDNRGDRIDQRLAVVLHAPTTSATNGRRNTWTERVTGIKPAAVCSIG